MKRSYSTGINLLVFGLLVTFFLSRTTKLQPPNNYSDLMEYLPVITSNIFADILIIFITFSGLIFTSNPLVHWYKKYRLAATIADTVIGILYILLARYLVHVYNIKTDLFTFTVFAVLVQMIMDLLFFLFFTSVPRGANDMLDLFKDYAKDVGFNGVLGDSILIVVGVLLSAFLKSQTLDFNIGALLTSIYLMPYFIYMRD